ncbi:hypothetical protein [Leptothoe sp. PORK10 BA2]|uniref:hypothetical protein n=1 Tax=Leptothoe sp. PORK10 BA2 TaxID=3110254 RepID=UPI002B1F7D3D|nr:hypothetical protein [Leptothoe sp. PORK10 BA2]MEA5467057.1 hypothetical protein [Leptothoe sp. PORK10 BA2]
MESELDFEAVLSYINTDVQAHRGHSLNQVEADILRYTWQELSYEEMATKMGYAPNTLRGVYGYNVWKLLGAVWSISGKFGKAKFKQVVEQRHRSWVQNQSRLSTVPNLTVSKQSDNSLETPLLARLVNTLSSGCKLLDLLQK